MAIKEGPFMRVLKEKPWRFNTCLYSVRTPHFDFFECDRSDYANSIEADGRVFSERYSTSFYWELRCLKGIGDNMPPGAEQINLDDCSVNESINQNGTIFVSPTFSRSAGTRNPRRGSGQIDTFVIEGADLGCGFKDKLTMQVDAAVLDPPTTAISVISFFCGRFYGSYELFSFDIVGTRFEFAGRMFVVAGAKPTVQPSEIEVLAYDIS